MLILARLLRSIANRIDPSVSTVVIRQNFHGTPRTTTQAVAHAARQAIDSTKQDDPIASYVEAVRRLVATADARALHLSDWVARTADPSPFPHMRPFRWLP